MKRAFLRLAFWCSVGSFAGASGVSGCGGAVTCEEELEIACECEDGRKGGHLCEDGVLSACKCEPVPAGICVQDADCSDGAFCNGIEICDPKSDDANHRGCVAAPRTPFCDDGLDCTEDSCDSLLDRCDFAPIDEDGDGHGDAACLDSSGQSLGSDCDDKDANRYPDNLELCDAKDHDEDCDESTFGWLDADGDGAAADTCCNGDNCGDDCNDESIAQRPLQPEFCDEVDNDCDGKVDNNTIEVRWHADVDGDGFGQGDDWQESCTPLSGRSLLATDCAPADPARHPAQQEICDLKDNNCDGRADEGPLCGVPDGYPFDDSGTGGAPGAGGSGNSGGSDSGGSSSGGAGGTGGSGGGPSEPNLIVCGDRDLTDATVISTIPGGDLTWSGKIHLTTNVIVNGRKLTITPGTEIYIDAGVYIDVGQFGAPQGSLSAAGTMADPIRFCGTEGTPGHWAGLELYNLDSESELSWVLVADAGATTSGSNAGISLNSPVDLNHVHVTGTSGPGVVAARFGAASSDLVSTGNLGYPLTVTSEAALGDTPENSYFLGNDDDYILINDTVWDAANVVLKNQGTPYLLRQDLVVGGSINVTFEAGSELVMDEEVDLTFAFNSATPRLLIQGTPEEPVFVRGRDPGAKYWGSFDILSTANSESRIDHVRVENGGSASAAFKIRARIPVNDVVIDDSKTQGLLLGPAGLASGSSGLHVSNTQAELASIPAVSLVDLPSDSTFTGGSPSRILVTSGNTMARSGTITDFGVPYYSETSLSGDGGAVVTFEAGVEFLFGNAAYLLVGYNGGAMTAHFMGTLAEPIIFRHVANLDAGWGGIRLSASASDASEFHYVQIYDTDTSSALTLSRNLDADHVTNSSFESTGYCIKHSYGNGKYAGNGNDLSNCALGAEQ